MVRLKDIAGTNLNSLKSGFEPEEINYVDISSVTTGTIQEIEQVSFKLAPGRARRVVKHGDIIWSTVRPNRKSYSLVLKPVENLIVSTGFVVVTATSVPYTYLYLALTTDNFVDYLVSRATGSAYPAVVSRDFQTAPILLPPRKLLSLFHEFVESIFHQRQNLHERNTILRRTRDLLLPKLISGEIDVSSWSDGDGEEVAQAIVAYSGGDAAARRVAEAGPVEPIEQDVMGRHSLWD